MSPFVKTAEKLYKDKYPDTNLSIERVFEDGNSVFIHAFHDKTSKEAIHQTMDVFTFDQNGKYTGGHTAKSRYSLIDTKGRSLTQGPTEVVDINSTDANKALIKRYFDNFIKRTEENDRVSLLTDPFNDFTTLSHDDKALLDSYHAKVSGFYHPDYFNHHAFGGGKEQVVNFVAEGPKGFYVDFFHLLIGQGNFVFLLYDQQSELGFDRVGQLFNIQNGQIKNGWTIV